MTARPRCPVCRRPFTPARAWQRYDSPECRMHAFAQRQREQMRAEVRAEIEREQNDVIASMGPRGGVTVKRERAS